MSGDNSSNKSNIHEKDWYKFDLKNVIHGYFSIHWEGLLEIDYLNVDNST